MDISVNYICRSCYIFTSLTTFVKTYLFNFSNSFVIGSVAQAPNQEPFLMLPQPMPTIIPQKPMSGAMVCVPLDEMGIDDGLSVEPLEMMPPVQDIGCEQSLPSVSQKPLFWPSGGKLTFSWICDVMLGFDWSSRNLPPCEFSSVLPFNVLDELVLSASKILKKEPNCVRIESDKAKVVVVGDLHGQLHDLLFLMQDAGFPNGDAGLPNGDQFYVFNGNYVNKGAWGLETFLLLLSWKVILLSFNLCLWSIGRGDIICYYTAGLVMPQHILIIGASSFC